MQHNEPTTFYRLVYSNDGNTFAHVYHTLKSAEYYRKQAVDNGCTDVQIEVYDAYLKKIIQDCCDIPENPAKAQTFA